MAKPKGMITKKQYDLLTKKRPTRVFMEEHERGWGSKIDETLYFRTREDAVKYADAYNLKYNNHLTAPDWYIVALVENIGY